MVAPRPGTRCAVVHRLGPAGDEVFGMNALPGFTVVVPSYNQGRFIDDTLRSLLDQRYSPLQVLVMDGGSDDDTVERLRGYGDAIEWVSEPDGGQSDAIARGFARAKHPWITWLNSDDVQTNGALHAVSDVICRDPRVEVVVGRGHYMDEDGGNRRPYPTIALGPGIDPRREMFEKGYVAQPSVFFLKAAYDRVGGIDRRLRYCMDYDLWARLALAGCRFAPCDADISGNRWYAETKTAANPLDLLAEVVATQARLFGRVSPYFVQAVSDNLYQKFHAASFGDERHILYRWLYFKSVWIWFNARRPGYCLKGLFTETLAKSGPLVNDRLTWADGWRWASRALSRPRERR
jgi:glycosyltransferase involved in cell wall biosynthesis